MPDRILRAAILDSDRVNKLTWGGEVFYRRLMSVADDYGRADARVQVLRGGLYPLKISQVSEPDIVKWLTECVTAGLIRFYQVDEREYLEIRGFKQRLRAMRSKFPEPPDIGGHLPAVGGHPPQEEKRNDSENEGEEKAPPPIGFTEKQEKPIEEDRYDTYAEWTNLILEERDQFFTDMLIKEKIELSKEATKDHLELVARYDWKFNSQQKFRSSVIKNHKEFIEKKKNGAGKFQATPTETVYRPSWKKPPEVVKDFTKTEPPKDCDWGALIQKDVDRTVAGEKFMPMLMAIKIDWLRKSGTLVLTDEQRESYTQQAQDEFIIHLSKAHEEISNRALMDQYKRNGKFEEPEQRKIQVIAKEFAYMDYLLSQPKPVVEYVEPEESFQPNHD